MSGGMGGPYAEAVVASVVAEIGADVRPSSSSTTPLSDFDADDSPPYRRAKEAQFMTAADQNAGTTPLGAAAVPPALPSLAGLSLDALRRLNRDEASFFQSAADKASDCAPMFGVGSRASKDELTAAITLRRRQHPAQVPMSPPHTGYAGVRCQL